MVKAVLSSSYHVRTTTYRPFSFSQVPVEPSAG